MLQKFQGLVCLLILLSLCVAACHEPFDTTTPQSPAFSLGEEIYYELCQRVAHSENPGDVSGIDSRPTCANGDEPVDVGGPRLYAFWQERDRSIDALDFLTEAEDPELSTNLRALLDALLPIFDAGLMQAQSREFTQVLSSLAHNQSALQSLAKLSRREGYSQRTLSLGMLRPLLAYEGLADFSREFLKALDLGGDLHPEFTTLLKALEPTTYNAAQLFDFDPSALERLLKLSLSQENYFAPSQPYYVLKRDERGLAIPRRINGSFPANFSDLDADGRADVGTEGEFIDQYGGLNAPTPFATQNDDSIRRDLSGRALTPEGELYYEYIDASQTLVAAFIRILENQLIHFENLDDDDDLQSVQKLLGPSFPKKHLFADGQELSYDGFSLGESPLLDAVHLASKLVEKSAVENIIDIVLDLLRHDEAVLAEMADLFVQISLWQKEPAIFNSNMVEDNTFAQDALLWFTRVNAVDGLSADIFDAFADPASAPLGTYFADMMRFRDVQRLQESDLNLPAIISLNESVDRDSPDTWENRSLFQRYLHLIHDSNGVSVCNKDEARMVLVGVDISSIIGGPYEQCELFEIDNLAVFYMQSLIGKATLEFNDPLISLVAEFDFLLEFNSGIDGFTQNPSPAALNRLVWGPQNEFLENLMAKPLTRDGLDLAELHSGTIFIVEREGFLDAVKPAISAFAKHDREDLFADLMSLLHTHWSSPQSETTQSDAEWQSLYSKQSNIRNLEELLARMIRQNEGNALGRNAALLRAIFDRSSGNRSGSETLVELAALMVSPESFEGLTFRDGRVDYQLQGTTESIYPLAPAWMALEVADRFAAAAYQNGVPDSSEPTLAETSIRTEMGSEGRHFADRDVYGLARKLLEYSRDELRRHRLNGDTKAWSTTWAEDLGVTLQHPMSAASISLFDRAMANADIRRQLQPLLRYMTKESSANFAYPSTLNVALDALQLTQDQDTLAPLIQALSQAMRHDGLQPASIKALRAIIDLDGTKVLDRLLKNLVKERPGTKQTALEDLAHAFAQVNRMRPGSIEAKDAGDHKAVFLQIIEFLKDESGGMERLYDLIENR